MPAWLQERRADQGRGTIVGPAPWLHGADVGAASAPVRGTGVASGMGAAGLRQTGTVDRSLEGLVEAAGVNTVPACDTNTRGYREGPGGEDIRPGPLLGDMGILPIQRMGQVDFTTPLRKGLQMPRLDPGQVVLAQRRQGGRNGGASVLLRLPRTPRQLGHLSVEVLDPEPDGSHEAQAALIEPCGHQWGGAVPQRHDHRDVELLVGAHGIDPPLHSLVEDARVEEHLGPHGMVLGGSSDIAVHGQVREERLDCRFRREEVVAGLHAMETDVAHDPRHRGALGVKRGVVETEHLSDFIDELVVTQFRRSCKTRIRVSY
jgi:hypothetical protein